MEVGVYFFVGVFWYYFCFHVVSYPAHGLVVVDSCVYVLASWYSFFAVYEHGGYAFVYYFVWYLFGEVVYDYDDGCAVDSDYVHGPVHCFIKLAECAFSAVISCFVVDGAW